MDNNGRTGDGTDWTIDDAISDWTDTLEFCLATARIGKFVEKHQKVTVAQVAREYPDYVPILWTVLEKLKQVGRIWWDEWKPAPTQLHAGDRRMVVECRTPQQVNERTWRQAHGETNVK